MKTKHQSYSEIVNVIQDDYNKGLLHLVECVKDFQNVKKERSEFEKKLEILYVEGESIKNTASHICSFLKITVPVSIASSDNIYIIDENYKLSVIKSDKVI